MYRSCQQGNEYEKEGRKLLTQMRKPGNSGGWIGGIDESECLSRVLVLVWGQMQCDSWIPCHWRKVQVMMMIIMIIYNKRETPFFPRLAALLVLCLCLKAISIPDSA
jgi:hypothetical protein